VSPARRQHSISERQQVALIITLSVLGILALWFFLLRPQAERRVEIARQWRKHLKSRYANMSKDDLLREEKAVQQSVVQIQGQWDEIRKRLSTYTKAEALVGAKVGKIDYKVELFNERARLSEKSRLLDIELVPRNLGMDDAVTSQEDARVLMLQLRAIEKLADLALDRRIARLIAIEPQPPILHRRADGDRAVFLEEYPVKAEFDIALETLYELLHAVFEKNRVFVFRQLRVNAGIHDEAPLRVNAVLSALILK
jgi:hypothetical protein